MEFLDLARSLLQQCAEITISHVPRSDNEVANELALQASSFRLGLNEINSKDIAKEQLEKNKDWRQKLKQYLSNPSFKAEYKLKQKALKYVLLDDELFKRRQEGLLLRCVNSAEAKRTVYEVHKGICGAHKLGLKMRWLIHRYGYYWPTITADCVAYVRGCEAY